MDKVMLIPSAALGLIFVIIYVWRCWKTGTEFNLAVMINTVFHASGIICGLFLIVSVFVPEAKEMISGIDIYVFVSGLAVFAVSAQSFHRDAIRSTGDCDSDAVDNSRIAQEESI